MRAALRMTSVMNQWVGTFCAALVWPLVFIIVFDIIMRSIFNSPTNWVDEMSGFLLAAISVLGGGYAVLREAHVRMDVLYGRLSPRTKAILDLVTSPLFFLFVAVLLWTGSSHFWSSLMMGEVSSSAWGPILWPVRLVLPVGALMLLLQGGVRFIYNLLLITTGRGAE